MQNSCFCFEAKFKISFASFWMALFNSWLFIYFNKQMLNLHPLLIRFMRADHVPSYLINCSERHAALRCGWSQPQYVRCLVNSNCVAWVNRWLQEACGCWWSDRGRWFSKYTPFYTSSPIETHLTHTFTAYSLYITAEYLDLYMHCSGENKFLFCFVFLQQKMLNLETHPQVRQSP